MTTADRKRLEEIRRKSYCLADIPFLLGLVDDLTRILHDHKEETGYNEGCTDGEKAGMTKASYFADRWAERYAKRGLHGVAAEFRNFARMLRTDSPSETPGMTQETPSETPGMTQETQKPWGGTPIEF